MNTSGPLSPMGTQKRQLIWNAAHADTLTKEDLMEILRYTARLAELYEAYILGKGIRYIWEADEYIQNHKGHEYPLL